MRDVGNRVRVVLIVLPFLLCSGVTFGQNPVPRSTPPPPPIEVPGRDPGQEGRPLTTIEEEMRWKRALKMAEKDHRENLERAREIAQIGKELKQSLTTQSSIDRETLKKVERLEKLTKKIRGEAGGEDEEVEIANRPPDVSATISQIADASETLSKDVQNTPRQVVSASVINNANVLLELIKIFRGFVRQP